MLPARCERVFTVPLFVFEHLLKDQARTTVFLGKLPEVIPKVRAHAFFCCGNKAQAHRVTNGAGQRSKRERQSVPSWVENAGSAIELPKALFSPNKMVDFFFRRLLHFVAHGG